MAKNKTMAAKNLKAKKCAMKDYITNDNHRLAGGSWANTQYLRWLCDLKPYSVYGAVSRPHIA